MLSMLAAVLVVAAPAEMRLAVVVGSNTAVEGRGTLRYAHADARDFAGVLSATGQFDQDHVSVLLDPAPDDVLKAVQLAAQTAKAAQGRALFVFYYSGHADDQALYPGGQPLALAQLKRVLEADTFDVRIGIIDSCRGGGWTQAKGLRPTQPFAVMQPMLSSEGTALLAASSGQEDAHEAEALRGSFFTHHLVAALRGAADTSGDGRVTLSEAFEYANRLTIRDSATRSAQPQHPSFDMRLRGRQDVVLADVGGSPTVLTVEQQQGPLQLVQLSSGLVVMEATPGAQVLRLAVPPGAYLVRRVTEEGVRAKEIVVVAGQASTVDETSLTVVGTPALASKGVELESRHRLALSAGALPGTFDVTVVLEASYRFRFADAFGVRFRLHGGIPVATFVRTQLEQDFGVVPTAFSSPNYALGSDLEWLPSFGNRLRMSVALGASAIGYSQSGGGLFGVVPAASAGLTVELRLLPRFALFVEGRGHVLITAYPGLLGYVAFGGALHLD